MTPRVYFDKGAISIFDFTLTPKNIQVCYSEALLLDMKNDKSGSYKTELDALNNCHALYLSHSGNEVTASVVDGHSEFEKSDRFEAEFIAQIYGFLNGGGPSESLLGSFESLQPLLDDYDPEIGEIFKAVALNRIGPDDRKLMQEQQAAAWKSEIQSQTKQWNQNRNATLKTALQMSPSLAAEIGKIIPEKPEGFEQILLAALMLGPLHLGQDKGITSPDPQKSKKSAENGYIDCLHIAYALHCNIFFTTDKATLRRFRILSEYWDLGKHGFLVEKSAP